MKLVTYRGPEDPGDGTTNLEAEVDGSTHVFPQDVAVEVSDAVAKRLGRDDLAGHKFAITDAAAGAVDKPETSGAAGEKE